MLLQEANILSFGWEWRDEGAVRTMSQQGWHFCGITAAAVVSITAAPPTGFKVHILLQMLKTRECSCPILWAQYLCDEVTAQAHGRTRNQVCICSLKLFMPGKPFFIQAWCWNPGAHILRALLEKSQLTLSHTALWVTRYSHLSQLLSILLPFPSLSWQTSASFHPPSSGVHPGTRSSLLRKSLGDCQNTEKKTKSQSYVSCRVMSFQPLVILPHRPFTKRHQRSLPCKQGVNPSPETCPIFLDGSNRGGSGGTNRQAKLSTLFRIL